ncbi:MAG: gamma carbonic anhydrase family protein [Pseudomonadales bacterium]|nr:gamma carbonic anhydrase family protein [Pseudomonadales bacterium]
MTVRSYLDHFPMLGDRVYVDESAIVIGKVAIGTDSSIWPGTVVRGDVHNIRIGERTNVQDGSVLHCTSPDYGPAPEGFALVIGNDVTVGHKAVLHGCTIGNRVLIGMGAIVMDGAVVEDEVFVGGGSMVTPGKVLKSGGLYVGSPATRVRELRPDELEFLRYSAAHYVKLKNLHLITSKAIM